MSLPSFLSHLGTEIAAFFKKADSVALALEPIVDVALPSFAGLYNMTLQAVMTAEALGESAATGGSTNAQKLALVLAAIRPQVATTANSLGIKVSDDALTKYVNAVVASINAFPPPVAITAPPKL